MYSSRLQSKIPVAKPAKPNADKGKSSFTEVDMDVNAVQLVCSIIASADYCEQVIPQMSEFMGTLCDGDIAGQIDLDGARSAFESVSALGLNSIINGLLTQLAKHVDGPTSTSGLDGIEVMAFNQHLWQLEMVRYQCVAAISLNPIYQLGCHKNFAYLLLKHHMFRIKASK